MAAVNEWIAREYFECLGYLVSQPRKYAVPGRQKLASEEVDLVIAKPALAQMELPSHMVWATEDFSGVQRAVVGIRGWHTERFYALTFEHAPEMLRFADADAQRFAARMLGSGSMAKVLCIPRLPASGELKEQSIAFLREKGIDGVISFQTMLAELVARVETNRNYEKSDLLQIIRLLKNYDLLKDPQLELFRKGRRASARPRTDSPATSAPGA